MYSILGAVSSGGGKLKIWGPDIHATGEFIGRPDRSSRPVRSVKDA
jgi:hypothetical protein